jgi:UDP-glucose 4-epimerase
MRVVVTGGSGRLGQSVVRGLCEAGHEVTSIDREAVAGLPGVQLQADLADAEATRTLLIALAPEAVVHLAAISVPFSAPEATILNVNTALAFSVVDAAVASGARLVLAASSPTVIGYGNPQGWSPRFLPLDETHPIEPWNAYSLSKQVIENVVERFVRNSDNVTFGVFRPCFVIPPEEWAGAPTQQGHSVADRLDDPSLASVSLFNYLDARDAAEFVRVWLERAHQAPNGSVFFVGAADALAREPLSELLPQYLPGTSDLAAGLRGTSPAFSSAKARELLGWEPRYSWRTELGRTITPSISPPASLEVRVS